MRPVGDSLKRHVSGVTMVEAIFYAAIFALLFVGVVTLVTRSLQGFISFRVKDEVVINGDGALREILRVAQQARNAYDPTSVFDAAAGQLSVHTAADPPVGDILTYVDFYIDNGVLYEKREGQNPYPLVNDRVTVQSFLLRRVGSSVQVELMVQGKVPRPVTGAYTRTFIGSVTPRGY